MGSAEHRGFHKLKEEPLRLDLRETEWCAMFSEEVPLVLTPVT